jgi:hypothetical protein
LFFHVGIVSQAFIRLACVSWRLNTVGKPDFDCCWMSCHSSGTGVLGFAELDSAGFNRDDGLAY